ncbi:unnamed protein product [Microthlaspi erraticum]|uniref:ABC transmembrane type-1 domain-containing protein n=1 Tax=Microthlaspi erraticum TaxID=1685480 RepID=A0A6D2KJ82_9BRAS|nr:unnamed protein product [Microthlaspi erraticum]
MHADSVDWMLMGLGLIGAVGDGCITPTVFLIVALLLNDLGGSSFGDESFMQSISEKARALLYVACAAWVICFIEAYCWTRTGERQASKMRQRYLRAVLRQDVGYFDLNVSSTSDVITSVSSDSLVIQDVLSEKLHREFHHDVETHNRRLTFHRPPFDPWTDVRKSLSSTSPGKYVKSTMRLVLLPSKPSHL